MVVKQAKLSEIMKDMAQILLRNPNGVPSSEAAHIALFFANIAWNECVGLDRPRDEYRHGWEQIEAENPNVWSEFKSNDIDAMIDELVEYKKEHCPSDQRRILVCGMLNENVHVEWLAPVAPGVDSKWEMELYGLVQVGMKAEAVRFLQDTRNLTQKEATKQVKDIAAKLGTWK